MPKASTIIRRALSPILLPGCLLTAMGLGLIPVDPGMAKLAAPFIDPFGIPFKPFGLVLGSCQILAGLRMWEMGPMPELFARLGLMSCSGCSVVAHHIVGEPYIHSIVYFGMVASLFFLDTDDTKGKTQ